MDQWVIDVLKYSPGYGAIIVIVYLGMKWHERISTNWLTTIEKIANQYQQSMEKIGEKCHESHEKTSSMYYEQSCRGQEVLMHHHSVMSQMGVHLDHFARAQEELSRAVREAKA